MEANDCFNKVWDSNPQTPSKNFGEDTHLTTKGSAFLTCVLLSPEGAVFTHGSEAKGADETPKINRIQRPKESELEIFK